MIASSGRSDTADYVVVGGGIIGLTSALELRRRAGRKARIVLLEKEASCGEHASGRNSGVLHAGFYYSADSMKARFSRDGNLEMTRYCVDRGLPINRCGKLVVTRGPEELDGLRELKDRGVANGVEVELVDAETVREIDPHVRTHELALWSPTTSSVSPREVIEALLREAREEGIEIRTGTAYVSRLPDGIRTSRGSISTGFVLNTAGLYADQIARDFGFSETHRILPFKGLYLEAESGETPLRTHVYPVPELRYPFLGVHFTIGIDGRTKIGPTAIPVLWREQYEGLSNFRFAELAEIGRLQAALFVRNSMDFQRLARRELAKYSKRRLVRLASGLVSDAVVRHGWVWGRPGIRAQLIDLQNQRLEMDFRVEGNDRSLHVLNAVSPAFTCAFPFARFVVDRVMGSEGGRAHVAKGA